MWTTENRPQYERKGLRYPSDLTDAEWDLVKPLIPRAKRGGRKREVVVREVLNGILYVLSAGCQWRALPKDLPPRSTVHGYLQRWDYDGTLMKIHDALYVGCREKAEREASPTACVIDSQSVKSAEKGGPALILTGSMQANWSRARSGISLSTCKVCCCTRSSIPLAFRIAMAASGCSPRCSANFLFSQNCSPTAPMRDQFSIPRSTKFCPTSKPKSSDAQIVPKGSCRYQS